MNFNNKFGKQANCPNFTSDQGRLFTNYTSPEIIDQQIMHRNNLTNSNQLRQFLQKNAIVLMNQESNRLLNNKCNNNGNFYLDYSGENEFQKNNTFDSNNIRFYNKKFKNYTIFN